MNRLLLILAAAIIGISTPAWALHFGLDTSSGKNAVDIILEFAFNKNTGSILTEKQIDNARPTSDIVSSMATRNSDAWTNSKVMDNLEGTKETVQTEPSAMAKEALTFSILGSKDPFDQTKDGVIGGDMKEEAKIQIDPTQEGSTDIPAVPEPATLLLMGTGLLLLSSIRRKNCLRSRALI